MNGRARMGAWIMVLCLATGLGAMPSGEALPAVETGAEHELLVPFDRLMRTFVADNGIPGAALAVARHGRLVYARGFGYADVDQRRPVQPDSIFRIASISKPITAVAILRLVEQRRCTLDDRICTLLPHQPHVDDGGGVDPRWQSVTIGHLLQHCGGWDRDVSIDPMFQSIAIADRLGVAAPAGPDDITRFMLGWPLDFEPGSRYAYSNFGYCVLGRVIEQIAGVPYELHVRSTLLQPLGIERMRLGKTLPEERCAGEVCYYMPRRETGLAVVGQPLARQVPRPYGTWYLEAMDAHGGWVGSAIDLVRFASRVAPGSAESLLASSSVAAMIARPPGAMGNGDDGEPRPRYYGLGWSVRPVGDDGRVNLWHMGLLDGTSALLVIRHDGLCWAAVFNTSRTSDGIAPATKLDPLVHEAADAVADWPQCDQFAGWLASH